MKTKGTYVERKVKKAFEDHGWLVVRATGSFGIADLVCVKDNKVIFVEVKSTSGGTIYYKGYMLPKIESWPFYVVADFGYGKMRVLKPKKVIKPDDGVDLYEFLRKA
ncbi:hypothetical protein DRN75_00205 [Nanoarchaeota archaeon]|nr:MAG: hypothetical protein DRN75_00205 [Nanoarchaeota archaeon]